MSGFIERHRLRDDATAALAREVEQRIERDGIELVRFCFPDLHGIARGKALTAAAVSAAFRDGVSITSSLLLKDTAHRTVVPVFSPGAGIGDSRVEGAGDMVMVPDPATFRVLPWAHKTGFMLCDLHYPDGSPVAVAPRHLAKRIDADLRAADRHLICGLEVEFHLFRLVDPALSLADGGQPGTPPAVSLLHQGYNYLTDNRFDQIGPIVDRLHADIVALGLPLTSVEIEFGPSQCEFVFGATPGLQAADDMILFRTAIKQIARRNGYHATFMCRPAFAGAMASGWHLHQSLRDGDGRNLFAGEDDPALSVDGRAYVAGLLAHAADVAVFAAPTINAYKRFCADSLAPDRVAWGRDNRGAMLRIIDRLSPSATRIENRVGEPAANPYLYIFSQAAAGIAGIENGLAPPEPVDAPYRSEAPRLPQTLAEAVSLLNASRFARATFGDDFIDLLTTIKRAEIARFDRAVTDWEHREYFEAF